MKRIFTDIVLYFSPVIPDPARQVAAEVLGPEEIKLEWKLPHPIDTFTYGNVSHEVRYRMLPFRNMYEGSLWVVVSIILCILHCFDDLNVICSIYYAAMLSS